MWHECVPSALKVMGESRQVIVIGAGLTGLTTAFYLTREGMDVWVLEQSPRTGGAIKTIHEQGFTFESGPNTGVMASAEVAELLEELSPPCASETARPQSGTRWVMKQGTFFPLPGGLISGMMTPLFSPKDKIRLLFEPFRKRGTHPDETVRDLVLRRMGPSFCDYAVDPFISGIYAGDPSTLVTRHALSKLYALEQNYGSFIRGAIRKGFEKKTPREKKATRDIFSMKGGLSALTDALASRIGAEKIVCSALNIQVSCPNPNYRDAAQAGRFKVTASVDGVPREWIAANVITTTGAHALPSLLPFIPADKMAVLNNARYAKVTQVILGYDLWDGLPLNAFGGLIPSREKKHILGVLFTSSFLSHRAPEGGAVLSVYLGGIRHPEYMDFTDEQLIAMGLRDIETSLHPSTKPTLTRVFRHPYAIPQYEKTTGERLDMVAQIEQTYPGLIIAGNLRNGIGISDRVKQGKETAVRCLLEG